MISAAFKDTSMPSTRDKVLLCLLAIFTPPLPIYLLTFPRSKLSTREFWISFIFTICFFAGGVLYSIYFILVLFPDARQENSYLYVEDLEGQQQEQPACENSKSSRGQSKIGTVQGTTAVPDASYMASSLAAEAEPLLPNYNELTDSSASTPYPKDGKNGNHKIQK
ncbi:hypothetical protein METBISCDRAFT_21118 [Metschnikowia bicuspidata]|uniref:Uncharacterized protein n=1 Tax=Metschnikowia bicuspidata TaxID=27322 RepID=A0A4P9ZII6_9ASCO|nr:hypothetical protein METBISCDRAFT_21118 [Metschnikowia bicuspidata]